MAKEIEKDKNYAIGVKKKVFKMKPNYQKAFNILMKVYGDLTKEDIEHLISIFNETELDKSCKACKTLNKHLGY